MDLQCKSKGHKVMSKPIVKYQINKCIFEFDLHLGKVDVTSMFDTIYTYIQF
jgi:hypothetical protein